MPEGTRVHDCVDKLKSKRGVNAYAVCQSSTNQSFQSGKPLKSVQRKKLLNCKVKCSKLLKGKCKCPSCGG